MISRSEEKLKALKEEIQASLADYQKIAYAVIDFSEEDRDSIFPKLEAVLEENQIREISLLFNNAGQGPHGPYIQAYYHKS